MHLLHPIIDALAITAKALRSEARGYHPPSKGIDIFGGDGDRGCRRTASRVCSSLMVAVMTPSWLRPGRSVHHEDTAARPGVTWRFRRVGAAARSSGGCRTGGAWEGGRKPVQEPPLNGAGRPTERCGNPHSTSREADHIREVQAYDAARS